MRKEIPCFFEGDGEELGLFERVDGHKVEGVEEVEEVEGLTFTSMMLL